MLFTDESCFILISDSRRIHIWIERGMQNHPSSSIIIKEFSFGKVVWLVAILTSTSSREVLLLMLTIVTKSSSLTFVFFTGVIHPQSSSWVINLHLIVQWLSQNSWRVRIFIGWIRQQGLWAYIQQYMCWTLSGDACQNVINRQLQFPSRDWYYKRNRPWSLVISLTTL